MQLEYAKDPQWANAEQTLIDLTIKWDTYPEELPFTADPNDVVEYGRQIYAAAVAGQFGVIAPPNPAPEVPQISPVDKLKQFLAANPDVAAALEGTSNV